MGCKKILKLLYKSNPSVFEWLTSPIIYKSMPEAELLKKTVEEYFSIKKVLYHYYSMAQTNYREHLKSEEVRLKKYFYALRPILAASYVIKHSCQPPIKFTDLMKSELPNELKEIVKNLLVLKKSETEMGLAKKIPELNNYIEDKLLYLKEKVVNYEESVKDWEKLDELFLKIL